LRADAALISADGAGGARTADADSSDRGRAAVVLPHRQPGLLYDAAAKPPCRPVASLGTEAAVTEMPAENKAADPVESCASRSSTSLSCEFTISSFLHPLLIWNLSIP